jgi:hypothetical protein
MPRPEAQFAHPNRASVAPVMRLARYCICCTPALVAPVSAFVAPRRICCTPSHLLHPCISCTHFRIRCTPVRIRCTRYRIRCTAFVARVSRTPRTRSGIRCHFCICCIRSRTCHTHAHCRIPPSLHVLHRHVIYHFSLVRPCGILWYPDWALWYKPLYFGEGFSDLAGHCYLWKPFGNLTGTRGWYGTFTFLLTFYILFGFYYCLHSCPLVFDSEGVLETRILPHGLIW